MKKIFLIAVVIFVSLYFGGKSIIRNQIISSVKDDYFANVEIDVTIGEMLETICKDIKWDYRTTDTHLYVTFEGNCHGEPIKLIFYIMGLADGPKGLLRGFEFRGKEIPDAEDVAPVVIYKLYLKEIGA